MLIAREGKVFSPRDEGLFSENLSAPVHGWNGRATA